MTTKLDWEGRVGRSWASEWQRTDRSFGGLTDQLLGKASVRSVLQALDVGCGAGELSMAMARGHSTAEVVGIDISPELLEVAQQRAGYLPNIDFELGDASNWTRPGFRPDLIMSRHGVMFFDDPVAAFAHLEQIAAREARLVFSCFRSFEENSWADRVAGCLPAGAFVPPDRFSPGPFAFADQAHVRGILGDAGWTDIAFEAIDYAFIAGTGEDAVGDALDYFQSIGPAARAAAGLSPDEKARFLGNLGRYLRNNEEGGIIALRAAAWIVTAKAGRS
ncbi:MAG: class I SAM-dependent methyltransferase [Sphingomonadaceae bacterium]|nr:class I SAM-dependent methyltransferase [Altererythrobacter sp.]MCP5391308.1 class I SAM-dependent methyltransferase [Sphingomonadaceae bacterium]MCP5394964.1 class I SAM-dependent methyltransferase [Sphingomonadaceae bacterium]